MTPKIILITGAISAALAIILGAFGAHALKAQLSSNALDVYQTAVQYHFYHSLGLLALAVIALNIQTGSSLHWSAIFMTAGILLFSGSLYLLAVTGMRWLGPITPIGGICFIVSWLLLAFAVWKAKF